MLKVENLQSGYGPIQVLWGISLNVDRGEIVTLLGANGAGKTTTIRTLAGGLRSTGGRIEFLGADITHKKGSQIVEAGLAEIPEGRQIWNELSVADNIELGAYSRRARPTAAATKEWVFTLFLVLAERRKSQAKTLSGGEQQMLAIARGLMSKPTLLMLDEPSLGLAPQVVEDMFRILARINDEEGISILLVEQNVDFALRIADRAYVLEHGRIARQGSAQELRTSDEIR